MIRQSPPVPAPPPAALAAILAGGRSRRYGAPKAPAPVGGVPLAQRVRDAVMAAGCTPVLIANDPEPLAWLELPARGDIIAGGGALSGIHAALRWAEQRSDPGALCVACDMPFLSVGLLREILLRSGPGRAVAPASDSRYGCEPLCAWYPTTALALVERRLRRGEHALGPLLHELGVELIPTPEVRSYGDPEILFLNVNRPADRDRADEAALPPEQSHVDR